MVSIVIPAYNSRFLKRSLISVGEFLKSDIEVEVIVIDDNSLEEFNKEYNNFLSLGLIDKLVINTRNRGPGYSRNEGINNASYNIICFLDSDDEFTSEKVMHIKEHIQNKCIFSVSSYTMEDRVVLCNSRYNLLSYIQNTNVGLSTVICNKELFRGYGVYFPDDRTRQDTRFIIASLKKIEIIGFPGINGTIYNKNPYQISRKKLRVIWKTLQVYYLDLRHLGLLKVFYYWLRYLLSASRKHL